MKITVFTPSHNTRYLSEAYQSLKAQTFKNWEWIILLNGDAAITDHEMLHTDPRITILHAPDDVKGIGALKRYACAAAPTWSDVLVELDHDDVLHTEALWEIAAAFEHNPHIGFAYSDTVRFRDDGAKPTTYDPAYGWKPLDEIGMIGPNRTGWTVRAFDPTPQALARIWYAPDHVRAWRWTTYTAIGGHDPKLAVCDDYDLLLRTYLATDFIHIKKPLYGYRVNDSNTSREGTPENALIQAEQFRLGNKYRVQIAETWARRKGLALVDLCSGPTPAEGYGGLDKCDGANVFRCDLRHGIPHGDNEVGVLRAQDALEHLPDKLHTMQEAHRVLAHGGWFFSDTPSTDGRGAFQDPTHVSYWNANSFWYYTSEAHRKFVPDAPHFQMWHLEDLYYSDWYKLHQIPYVRAHMSAIKDGGIRLPGPYDYKP